MWLQRKKPTPRSSNLRRTILKSMSLLGPSFNFGPFAPGFEHLIAEPDVKSLSTNRYLYALLNPDNTNFPSAVDVRDVARAHVLALQSRLTTEAGRRRFAVVSPYESSFQEAIAVIARDRPELEGRLMDATRAPIYPSYTLSVNWDPIEDILGLKRDSFVPWKKTVLDAADSLVRMENLWKERGFKVLACSVFLFYAMIASFFRNHIIMEPVSSESVT
ncbi:hypothetical protein DFS33DRAFT_798977 [Desarmillaria ectypa]|nr:hypothetical protein DFS33DRAFT_798977 [Desarmillaria ectypa]